MRISVIIFCLVITYCPVRAQDKSSVITAEKFKTGLDSFIYQKGTSFLRQSKAPGIIIGLIYNGQRQYFSFGITDSVSGKIFDKETIFEIGSISKTFTANLIWQLAAENKINPEHSIAEYLPFTDNRSTLEKIYINQIAKHNSGLPRLPSNMSRAPGANSAQPYQLYSKDYLYDYLKETAPVKPGTYSYSNLGFGILGTIAENIKHKGLEELYKDYIFRPLKMNRSYLERKHSKSDSATGYFMGKATPYWLFGSMAGAGAIKSNAEELLNYLQAHFDSTGNKISKAGYQLRSNLTRVNERMMIGYAWHSFEDFKRRVIWHNGGTYGFSTFAGYEPTGKIAIVIASNSSGVNNFVDKLAHEVMEWLINEHERK